MRCRFGVELWVILVMRGERRHAGRAGGGDRSLVIRKLGGTRARDIAIHRFLSAPSVTCGEMVETLAHRTAAACKGRRIVAAQDTTEINASQILADQRALS